MDPTSTQDPAITGLSTVSATLLGGSWDGGMQAFVSAMPDPQVRIAALERLSRAILTHTGTRGHVRYPAMFVCRWLGEAGRSTSEIAAVMRRALDA